MIALGIKVGICGIRVKQHIKVILQDEDDDPIVLHPDINFSYEMISPPGASLPPKRKVGTTTMPGASQNPEMSRLTFHADLETDSGETQKAPDTATGTTEPEAIKSRPQGETMSGVPELDEAVILKRRISRMTSITEEAEKHRDVPTRVDEEEPEAAEEREKVQ